MPPNRLIFSRHLWHLLSYCKGISSVKGVSRLIFKESNRAKTLKEEFGKLNIKIEINDDTDVYYRRSTSDRQGLNRMTTIVLQWLLQLQLWEQQAGFISGILNALQNHIRDFSMISDSLEHRFMNDCNPLKVLFE